MAKVPEGFLGGFTGKMGNVIGSSHKGTFYIKQRPESVYNPNTEKQQAQRAKIKLVHAFLRVVKDYVKFGYHEIADKQTPYNMAVSYVMNHAVTGEFPNLRIDYPNVRVSRGSLHGMLDMCATLLTDTVHFEWKCYDGMSADTYLVTALVYNATTGESVYDVVGSTRDTQGALPFPANWQSGDELHAYYSLFTDNYRKASESVYVSVQRDGTQSHGQASGNR